METKKVTVLESIYDENDRIAAGNNALLSERGIFAVNVMGAPGAGKTTCLIRILERLKAVKPYVVEGDIESDIDTRTLNNLGIEALQINTGGACHLDSPMLRAAIEKLNPVQKGILFIENVGNLVCPAEFVIGEHIKMLVCSTAEGSDKPYKYPLAFEKADAILLNKSDLKPYVDFDDAFFRKGVAALNGRAPVFEVSGKTGAGFDAVAKWLGDRVKGEA